MVPAAFSGKLLKAQTDGSVGFQQPRALSVDGIVARAIGDEAGGIGDDAVTK
jgi:hypothetical protein